MTETDPAKNDNAEPSSAGDAVTDPFSRMRARYLFGWLVVAAIVATCASILVLIITQQTGFDYSVWELLSDFIIHSILLLGLWLYLVRNRVSWKQLVGPVLPRPVWTSALRLVPLLIAFSLAGFILVAYPLAHVAPQLLDELMSIELFVTASNPRLQLFYDLVASLGIVVAGPIMEELLFRGVLLHRWSAKWNPVAALWVTSLLFGICHLTSVVGATVFGLVMAILYIETGSLLIPLALHAANNAIVCALRIWDVVLPSWALPDFWSNAADIRDTPWIAVVLLGLSIPPMMIYLFRHWPRKDVTLPYFRVTTFSAPPATSVPAELS